MDIYSLVQVLVFATQTGLSLAPAVLEECVCATEVNSLFLNESEKQALKLVDEVQQLLTDVTVLEEVMENRHEAYNIFGIDFFCDDVIPDDCFKASKKSEKSAVHMFKLDHSKTPVFKAFCHYYEVKIQDKGRKAGFWMVVARRFNQHFSFDRTWDEYVNGFGDANSDFFVGLNILHALTHDTEMELQFFLAAGGIRKGKFTEHYDAFAIENEKLKFKISTLGNHTSSNGGGDVFRSAFGADFSTADVDNDIINTENCAKKHSGGWWFQPQDPVCGPTNLFGEYDLDKFMVERGITWNGTRMTFVEMMVRPKNIAQHAEMLHKVAQNYRDAKTYFEEPFK